MKTTVGFTPTMRTVLIGVLAGICVGGVVSGVLVYFFAKPAPMPVDKEGQNESAVNESGGTQHADDAGGGNTAQHAGASVYLRDAVPSSSKLKRFQYGVVSTDSAECSTVGKQILAGKGSAVDAAIAVLLCNGATQPQSSGIGGGFIMTVSLANGTRVSLVAREMAPAVSGPYMYKENGTESTVGPRAAGVPGEILGFWEAKQKLGNPEMPWEELVRPTVNLCRKGIKISHHLGRSLSRSESLIRASPELSRLFLKPKTGKLLVAGETFQNNLLADTLEIIGREGADSFYTGKIGRALAKDIEEASGFITLEDLKNYRVVWETPATSMVSVGGNNFTLLSSPPPGSGAIMSSIVGMASTFQPEPMDKRSPLLWHRFLEACKYAYAQKSKLGDWNDPDISTDIKALVGELSSQAWREKTAKSFRMKTSSDPEYYGAEFLNTEDHGTSHTSILSPQGDAVSVTSTLSELFGSGYVSPSTGILLNNQMVDFSFPGAGNSYDVQPSPNNFPKPGKRPVSSMCPSVVVDNQGRNVVVVGAGGGFKIITSVAQVLMRMLFLGEDPKSAVDARRLHNQLLPVETLYEEGTASWIIDGLKKHGHELKPLSLGGSIVHAILVDDDAILANADFRKDGGSDGF